MRPEEGKPEPYLPRNLSGERMTCAKCLQEIPVEEANADDLCIICADLQRLFGLIRDRNPQKPLPTIDDQALSALPPSDR